MQYVKYALLYTVLFMVMTQCIRANNAQAAPSKWTVLEPTYLAMEANKIEKTYDPYLPYIGDANDSNSSEYWTYGAAIKANYDLLKYKKYGLYWRNNIHMDATNKQVRRVAWEWDIGISLGKKIEIYHYHHSQHVLDAEVPGRYPLIDRYGVRFIFINK